MGSTDKYTTLLRHL